MFTAVGIVHRDIKSNNVKITPAGQVKLLDFGIAKSGASPALTVTGAFVGTLQYLSPEQLVGGVADVRSDIWSLGVLLYEMTTCHLPFDANTIGELCQKITKASYTPPSVMNQNRAARSAKCNLSMLEEESGRPISIGARPASRRELRGDCALAAGDAACQPGSRNRSVTILNQHPRLNDTAGARLPLPQNPNPQFRCL